VLQAIGVASLVALSATHAWPQTYTTLINNGPSANRVDVVFLGDGYTQADLNAGVYAAHVNNYVQYMFSNTLRSDPFYRYRNLFNVHVINLVSVESGADIPPQGVYRNTALDASYYWDGVTERLLSVNATKANNAANAALIGAGFTAEMKYVTVNSTRYGGAGGSWSVYAGGNGSSSEIALHEMAHSFSNLADEYGGNTSRYTGPEINQVNVTTDPSGTKWSRWLGYNQPGIGLIGAYEGARYYDSGLYRPSSNSKMRSLGQPFDAISREKTILDFFGYVNPIDHYLANTETLFDPNVLFVDTADPDLFNVEWRVNGSLLNDVNGEVFDLLSFGYGPGAYTVTARAFDPTGFDPVDGWVRMDQYKLEQTVEWNVVVTVPEPSTWVTGAVGFACVGWGALRCRKQA
jgi:hypothetical protein